MSSLWDGLFPSDLPEPAHWERRYPPRDLPATAHVTRFAPSPTGAMHIGGLYTALISRDLARGSDGTYLVRIEDTDRRREVDDATRAFGEALDHLDLLPDEGGGELWPDRGGEAPGPSGGYGPYRQSDRRDVYRTYARELLRAGRAYLCFCDRDHLARAAAEQRAAGLATGYYGKWAPCRSVPPAEALARALNHEPYTVRWRCPQDVPRRVRFQDRVRGRISMLDNAADVVLLKNPEDGAGLPTYHFAHVVDDHLMRVTLVVRGDEWLSSVPLHRQLFAGLGWTPVDYAHVAPLMTADGRRRRKLSKRTDTQASAAYYEAAGYPPTALRQYLRGLASSRIAAHPPGSQARTPIELADLGTSGPLLDLAKLRSISRTLIAGLPPEEVYRRLITWSQRFDAELHAVLRDHHGLAVRAVAAGQTGSGTPRKDLACWSDFRDAYGFYFPELFSPVTDPDDPRLAAPRPALAAIADFAAAYPAATDPVSWFARLRAHAGAHGQDRTVNDPRPPGPAAGELRQVTEAARTALTGRPHGPDLYVVSSVLGAEETRARLRRLARLA